MVAEIQGKNLANFFGINESRPIPNIVAKEPYMYKAQVLDKIAKGKGYEVLRNKVISHISEVETHIKNCNFNFCAVRPKCALKKHLLICYNLL